jgi:hypothetical protein
VLVSIRVIQSRELTEQLRRPFDAGLLFVSANPDDVPFDVRHKRF